MAVTPASPSVVSGQNITFTAKISNTSATNEKPTGSVMFEDNGVQFGSTITLPAEAAGNSTTVTSAATSFTVAGGVNTITAVYTNSDGNFNSSMGSATPFTAAQASTTTSDVTSSVASPPYGQTVTFSATISAVAPGTGVPTGTVNFLENTTTLGSGTVSGTGVATFSIASLTAGTHIITASYGGDTKFKASNDVGSANKLQQEVTQAGTALSSVTSSLTSPYTFGQTNTYTATVSVTSGLGGGTLAGTVTFKDGGVNLGSGTVGAGGVATFSTASLIVGTHTITASYGGTANYLSSNSAAPALVQTVTQGTSSIAVSVPAGTVYFGQVMTYTATVNNTGGTGAPTGTVTFTILNGATTLNSGSMTLGSINSTQSQAKYVTTGNMGGITQTVSAKYNGDTNFPTHGPATGTNAITAANTKTTVSVSSNNLAFGGSWYPLATVSVVPGQGAGIPGSLGLGAAGAGTVTFTATILTNASASNTFLLGGTFTENLGTKPVNSNGQASWARSPLPAGQSHGVQRRRRFDSHHCGCLHDHRDVHRHRGRLCFLAGFCRSRRERQWERRHDDPSFGVSALADTSNRPEGHADGDGHGRQRQSGPADWLGDLQGHIWRSHDHPGHRELASGPGQWREDSHGHVHDDVRGEGDPRALRRLQPRRHDLGA